MNWESKLNQFLTTFAYKDDMIGVLACGSYITGAPTKHSDLDVHIVLKSSCNYRVKLNRYVDGLLIECFINPPQQIRSYFAEDYRSLEQASMNQFATGKIVLDSTGEVATLKSEAQALIAKRFDDVAVSVSELDKYTLWDMQDDLEDALLTKRRDFNFLYYNYCNKLLKLVCKVAKYPYGIKTVHKGQFDALTKQKYSLPDFPNPSVSKLITKAITAKRRKTKVNTFKQLCQFVWQETGGFDINTFSFKSPLSL